MQQLYLQVVFIVLLLSHFEIFVAIKQEVKTKAKNSQADNKAAEKLFHRVIFITSDLALHITDNSGNRETSDVASVLYCRLLTAKG